MDFKFNVGGPVKSDQDGDVDDKKEVLGIVLDQELPSFGKPVYNSHFISSNYLRIRDIKWSLFWLKESSLSVGAYFILGNYAVVFNNKKFYALTATEFIERIETDDEPFAGASRLSAGLKRHLNKNGDILNSIQRLDFESELKIVRARHIINTQLDELEQDGKL